MASYAILYKRQRYFYAVSTILSILSVILFQYASSWYQYRQRNEHSDVNRQNIIEQYTERQLCRGQILKDEAFRYSDNFTIAIHTVAEQEK